MAIKKNEQTFEEKYGLQGKGKRVRVSEQTKQFVKMLSNRSKRIIDAGKDWAKTHNGTFG